jgi:hypothetical protein
MTLYDFHDAVSEAEDFIALARQHQTDGDTQEAEAKVAAAVYTLEQLLPPPEPETI